MSGSSRASSTQHFIIDEIRYARVLCLTLLCLKTDIRSKKREEGKGVPAVPAAAVAWQYL